MEILREALIFFAIVFLIVGGAVYLSDRAPSFFSTGEQTATPTALAPASELQKKPLSKIFFKATLKLNPPISFSGRQLNETLSITYSGGDVPFALGSAKIKGAEGTHSLQLKNYLGGFEFSRTSGGSKCMLAGKSREVSLDTFTFSEDSIPVDADLACSIFNSEMAVISGFSAEAREGSVNMDGNSALFSLRAGDIIDVGEFKGSVQFNAVSNELVLAGFSHSLAIRKSDGSSINLS